MNYSARNARISLDDIVPKLFVYVYIFGKWRNELLNQNCPLLMLYGKQVFMKIHRIMHDLTYPMQYMFSCDKHDVLCGILVVYQLFFLDEA